MSSSTAGCAAEKPDGAPDGVSAQAAMSSADGGGATGMATDSAEPAAGAADWAEAMTSVAPAAAKTAVVSTAGMLSVCPAGSSPEDAVSSPDEAAPAA